MILIVKPTSKCNFCCNFCSAKNLKIQHSKKVPEFLKQQIKILSPEGIIITGGDPLMVNPSYYYELLDLTSCEISFTTNLKDFYLNPDKWTSLFLNERINIGTSFQYGTGRLWDKDTPYTEEKFKEVMTLFKEKVGYTPSFIAVITEENEDKALDHVYLAKELGTQCRLNGVFSFGASNEDYPRYKMVDIWLKVKELGLEEYINQSEFFYKGNCNLNTNLLCQNTIRVCWINQDGSITYGNCEDQLAENMAHIEIDKEKPVPIPTNIPYKNLINKDCLTCELNRFCNGCRVNRLMAKKRPEYCKEMLKRKEKILQSGWLL